MTSLASASGRSRIVIVSTVFQSRVVNQSTKQETEVLLCSNSVVPRSWSWRTPVPASRSESSVASHLDPKRKRPRHLALVCEGSAGWHDGAGEMGRRPEHSFYPGSGYCGRRCHHPHIHFLVPGGGIFQEEALRGLCQAAVLRPRGRARLSLRRYTHRVAISNRRLIAFRRDRRHLPLQGLSPRWSPAAARHDARAARVHPPLPAPCPATGLPPHPPLRLVASPARKATLGPPPLAPPCPCCGGRMTIIETFGRWSQPRAPPHAPASTGSTPS